MSKDILEDDEVQSESAIAARNYDRYRYAVQRGHDEYVKKADVCTSFLFGDQWDKADTAKLKNQGRPYLTINKIKPVVRDLTGEFLAHRADVRFTVGTNGDPNTAAVLNKVYQHINHAEQLDDKELEIWLDGITTSRGYYDVRISYDDNFNGDISVSVPNPKNVIPDPDAHSADPRDWGEVTYVYDLSPNQLASYYGEDILDKVSIAAQEREQAHREGMDKDQFGNAVFYAYQAHGAESDPSNRRDYFIVERQHRKFKNVQYFVDKDTGEFRKIPENWSSDRIANVLEKSPQLEVQSMKRSVIQWTVSCGNVLLHDSISPYRTFTFIPFYPLFMRGRTAGAVEDLIDPQRNYNKTRSQELHIVNGTANAGWKVKKGALTNMSTEDLETEGAKTGIVLEFKDDPKDIERVQPVNIPQGMDRISSKASEDISTVSSIDDNARGVARADVAGKSIQARRDAALVSMSIDFQSLARTRRWLALKILELVQDFYIDRRTFIVEGQSSTAQAEEITINDEQVIDETTEETLLINDVTAGEYSVKIIPAPQRRSEEEQQFAELMQMQEMGITIPSHVFIENSHLANKPELIEVIKAANGMGEPSEEQKELEREQAALEMEEKRAAIMSKRAQAQLSAARAKKVLQEIENADLSSTDMERLMIEARRLDNEHWHNQQSIEIRRRAQEAQEAKVLMDDDRDIKKLEVELDNRERDQQESSNEQESREQ